MANHDVDTDLVLSDGTPIRMGHNLPDVLKFAGAPAFDSANPILKESEWEEHDDLAPFMPPIEAQQNNNCTNASLATEAKCLFEAAGIPAPRFSWSYLYALNNGGRDSGASCRDLAANFKDPTIGLAPASVWPDDKIYEPRSGMPQNVVSAASEWSALEIFQCFSFEEIASAVTQRFGVYFGICLGRRSFFNTGSNGVVPEWDGSIRNGHAMWARGLTKKFSGVRLIVPNTWGPGFGDRGVGYMERSYFWAERGSTVGLDAYAIRAVRRNKPLPLPKVAA